MTGERARAAAGSAPPARAGAAALSILLCLAMLRPAPSYAQSQVFLGPYQAATRALDEGELEQARQLLEQAIAANPESGRYRGAGTRFVIYIPHHYHGLVLFRMGDCRAALRAWESVDPETLAELAPEEHARWEELRRGCERRAAVADRADAVGQEIARARRAGERIRGLLQRGDVLDGNVLAEIREDDQRAAASLSRAEEALRAGIAEESMERVEAAARAAADARTAWEDLEARAERRLAAAADAADEEVPSGAGDIPEDKGSAGASGDAGPDSGEAPETPEEAEVEEAEVEEAEVERLDEPVPVRREEPGPVDREGEGSDDAGTPSAGEAPDDADAAPRPGDWRAPGRLQEAARAYFERGAYRRATELLAGTDFGDPRARSLGLLLLAASHHALATIESDEASEHLQRAKEYARGFAELGQGSAALDSEFFSPRFIRFIRSAVR